MENGEWRMENDGVQRIKILGVPIDAVTQEEAIQKMSGFFRSAGQFHPSASSGQAHMEFSRQFHVATPNPEMLVEAQRNPTFREVLRKTSLNLPDGVGLVWALRRSFRRHKKAQEGTRRLVPSDPLSSPLVPSITRVTGTDTLLALCGSTSRISPPERIFLLGAAPGIAEKAAEVLRAKNPALKIVGTFASSPKEEEEQTLIDHINAVQPTLLFVAYGAPAQDLWIARNLSRMPSVKVAMGVGGAFDFIAGRQKRAPRMFQRAGLEWLWRLMREPRRIKRIWNAVIVFPWMLLCHAERNERRE